MDNYNAKNVLNTKELKEAITIIEHIRKEQLLSCKIIRQRNNKNEPTRII